MIDKDEAAAQDRTHLHHHSVSDRMGRRTAELVRKKGTTTTKSLKISTHLIANLDMSPPSATHLRGLPTGANLRRSPRGTTPQSATNSSARAASGSTSKSSKARITPTSSRSNKKLRARDRKAEANRKKKKEQSAQDSEEDECSEEDGASEDEHGEEDREPRKRKRGGGGYKTTGLDTEKGTSENESDSDDSDDSDEEEEQEEKLGRYKKKLKEQDEKLARLRKELKQSVANSSVGGSAWYQKNVSK